MIRLTTSVNRSGKQSSSGTPGQSGNIPFTTKIPYIPEADAFDYEIFLVSSSTMGCELISHDDYFTEHNLPVAVYALVCTDRSVGGTSVKAVHFLCRVLGLSDVNVTAEGDRVFTMYADLMALPGQDYRYDPYSASHLWNAKVMDASVLSSVILFRPAYDVMRWIGEPGDGYQTTWSYDDAASKISIAMSAPETETSTSQYACATFTGTDITQTQGGPSWTDGLVFKSVVLKMSDGVMENMAVRLFFPVAVKKSQSGTFDLYWTCAVARNKAVGLAFMSATSAPTFEPSLSGEVKMLALGPWLAG